MATTLMLPTRSKQEQSSPQRHDRRFGAALVSLLTILALAVHGYHPYAEDGGIYLAGVKRLLNPALYPRWSEFVTEHLRFSLFAPLVVTLVRTSHLKLMTVWLLLYAFSFWSTLFAAWMLAVRCYTSREARCGAVALLAVWLPIPVAGTSLMLMDPYFSARSISTPCGLLALVGVLDLFDPQAASASRRIRGLALCLGSLTLAAFVHPLMAAYALGCVLLLSCLIARSPQIRVGGPLSLVVLAFFVASILYATAPHETTAYLRVALTRSYWFVARWQWYEQFGLVAPLAILSFFGWSCSSKAGVNVRGLARTAVVAGAVALLVAVLFARAGAPTYLVARLQPLRIFQIIYVLMILALGASLGETFLKHRPIRWTMAFTLLAATMFYAERQTFPQSTHIELPQRQPQNGWQRTFEWISKNTPVDAFFALDANYITQPGEDAQTFRAIAERSVLADYSKDGGEASITPELTAAWSTGQTAQTGLNTVNDAARLAALTPLGVSYIVLPTAAATGLTCEYDNATAKVCRLPVR